MTKYINVRDQIPPKDREILLSLDTPSGGTSHQIVRWDDSVKAWSGGGWDYNLKKEIGMGYDVFWSELSGKS